MLAFKLSGPRRKDWDFEDLILHPSDKDGSTLRTLQREVGGLIECIALNDDLDAWINEEGKLIDLPPTAGWLLDPNGPVYDTLRGPVIVLRHDDEGNTTPILPSDLDTILQFLKPYLL